MISKIFHKRHVLNLSSDALGGIIHAICDTPAPTRKSIAGASNYSEVTVGKVFDEIYISNLAQKDIRKPQDGGRACSHLRFNDEVKLLIIDISTRIFHMALVSISLEVVYMYSYIYSDSLRFEDNFLSFLSCGANELQKHGKYYSACVLIKENEERPCSHSVYSHIPFSLAKSFSPENSIKSLLGYTPDLVLTPDSAVKEYLARISHGEDISYISLGNNISMYHLSKDGSLTVFQPWNLIVNDQPLWKYLSNSTDIKTYYTTAAKLINTLECTFPVKSIIIQSDSLCLGTDFINEIKEYINSIYPTDANIILHSSSYPIHIIGSASLARKLLLKKTFISKK